METRPSRWFFEDHGHVHRLVRRDALEEYDSADSENWIGLEDEERTLAMNEVIARCTACRQTTSEAKIQRAYEDPGKRSKGRHCRQTRRVDDSQGEEPREALGGT
jgi:hypothetical protein